MITVVDTVIKFFDGSILSKAKKSCVLIYLDLEEIKYFLKGKQFKKRQKNVFGTHLMNTSLC